MSLVSAEVSKALPSLGVPKWTKVTKTFTDLSAAAVINNITIYTLAIREYVHDIKIVPSVAFSGGLVATTTLSVGVAGSLVKYSLAVNVFTGNTALNAVHAPIAGLESTSGTVDLKLSAVSTVANLDQLTAGTADVYILTSILPT